ncbi:hypothetical protein [Nonomuraea typhae]|uniref:hypothetical protein n=1 Tax=Nonomuraea typhae TaxID=2603600 RepID=UPI0012FB831E|nr:hypothetical protein [Nonomuraea typhae]
MNSSDVVKGIASASGEPTMAEPRKKPATKSGKAKKATIKATRQAKAAKRQASRKPMDEA